MDGGTSRDTRLERQETELIKKTVAADLEAVTAERTAIDREIFERKRVLSDVNARLHRVVLSSYDAFVHGMEQVDAVGTDLSSTVSICRKVRDRLHKVKEELTKGGLMIASKTRKRALYQQILKSLTNLQALAQIEAKLRKEIEAENYPAAVAFCIEARALTERCRVFKVGLLISNQLRDHYDTIEKRLDESLKSLCSNHTFRPAAYSGVVEAYRMLGRTARVFANIQDNFMAAIHTNTRTVVNAHVLLNEENSRRLEELKGMKFRQLCEALDERHFLACLRAILEYLCDLMYNLHCMVLWHKDHSPVSTNTPINAPTHGTAVSAPTPLPANPEHTAEVDLGVSLDRFRRTIWDECQKKVALLIESAKLASFQIEKLLRVWDAVLVFTEFGEDFSENAGAPALQRALRSQSQNIWDNFHRSKLEGLRNLLEHETWQPIFIENFSLNKDIKEFREFLGAVADGAANGHNADNIDDDDGDNTGWRLRHYDTQRRRQLSRNQRYFARFSEDGNPFSATFVDPAFDLRLLGNELRSPSVHNIGLQVGEEGDSVNSTTTVGRSNAETAKSDGAGELLSTPSTLTVPQSPSRPAANEPASPRTPVPMATPPPSPSAAAPPSPFSEKGELPSPRSPANGMPTTTPPPILTNSSINALHYIGKYLLMTRAFQPIANEIFDGIVQMFDYYLITVYSFFVQPKKDGAVPGVLVLPDDEEISVTLKTTLTRISSSLFSKIRPAIISPHVDLSSSHNFFGLPEKLVAIESLAFLATCLSSVRAELRTQLDKRYHSSLVQFYAFDIDCTGDLRALLYRQSLVHLLSLDTLVPSIEKLKWERDEVMEHNSYTDTLVQEFSLFGRRIAAIGKRVPLSPQVVELMWKEGIMKAMKTLVEGFSRVKKCNVNGRALMSLDLQTLQKALEKMSPLRPLPGVQLVENYIKAFYLPDKDALTKWMNEHTEYTLKQLQALQVLTEREISKRKASK